MKKARLDPYQIEVGKCYMITRGKKDEIVRVVGFKVGENFHYWIVRTFGKATRTIHLHNHRVFRLKVKDPLEGKVS